MVCLAWTLITTTTAARCPAGATPEMQSCAATQVVRRPDETRQVESLHRRHAAHRDTGTIHSFCRLPGAHVRTRRGLPLRSVGRKYQSARAGASGAHGPYPAGHVASQWLSGHSEPRRSSRRSPLEPTARTRPETHTFHRYRTPEPPHALDRCRVVAARHRLHVLRHSSHERPTVRRLPRRSDRALS